VSRIGRSSIAMAQALVRPARPEVGHGPARAVPVAEAPIGDRIADVATVVVAYDYREERSVPVPDDLRARLAVFTGALLTEGALLRRRVPSLPS
jgi:acyl-CoA thioesterase FadM